MDFSLGSLLNGGLINFFQELITQIGMMFMSLQVMPQIVAIFEQLGII